MKKISFVVFHQDISKNGIDKFRKLAPTIAQGSWTPEYLEEFLNLLPMYNDCIDIFFQSVRANHLNCECIVLTDQETKFNLPKEIKILRCPVASDQPALSRLHAQIDFIKTNKDDSHIVFLDYDMIVQGSLYSIFEKDFDLAFTFRSHPVPFNGGVLMVHADGKKGAISFLKSALAIYNKNYSDYALWGGAQRSISDAAGFLDITTIEKDLIDVDGIKILLLPEEIYNFTFGGDDMFLDFHPEKVILHFKGRRKKNMITYWNEYLRSRK